MNGDHYGHGDYPPPGPRGPPPAQYSSGSRKPMDKSAVVGIVITSICFVMLFVALFAPWFTIKQEKDTYWDYWDDWDDEPEYKWNSYDYDGEGYGDNDKDKSMKYVFMVFDSMDNGVSQGFWGIILGMVFGIGLIVLGNIHLHNALHKKLMVFFRGTTGVFLLLPATLLTVCGSKFIGYSLYESTSGGSDDETVLLCIVPYVLFLVGITLFIMAFGLIKNTFNRLSRMRGITDCKRDKITSQFNVKFKRLSIILVIFGMLAVVTLPLLPIVSETEDEYNAFIPSGIILSDGAQQETDFANYLGWVNFAFWFIFPLALIAMLAALFLESGINDLTGYILGLGPCLIAIFLLLALIFKILFIVDVFSDDYGDLWYGYNYLPLLVMIGLIIICIMYMVHTIKGSTAYFKSMPRRPAPVGYGAPPPRRDDHYHDGHRRDDHHGDSPRRDDYYDNRERRDPGYDHRRNERDYPPPPF